MCTARPRLASRRVSSSGLATDSSPAGLPHRAVETLGGSSNFQTRALKTEVKFPSMSHACLCSLARALGCDKCGCASSSSASSSSSSTSPDLFPATTINYKERVEGCGHVHPCSRLCLHKRTTDPPVAVMQGWSDKSGWSGTKSDRVGGLSWSPPAMVNHEHQRRYQSRPKSVNLQLITKKMYTPGCGLKTKVPDNDVLFPENKPGRTTKVKVIIIPAGKKTIQRQFADEAGTSFSLLVA